MEDRASSRIEQIIQLLVEELEERIWARAQGPRAEELKPAPTPSPPSSTGPSEDLARAERTGPELADALQVRESRPSQPAGVPEVLAEEPAKPPAGAPHAARLLGRLAVGLLAAIVLVNIPLSRHGTTLATAMPDSASMVIRDGLVVKEEGNDEIYVYQDGRFRWISSLDAFEHFGFAWRDVHIVEDGFLNSFEVGRPLHVLLKCASSPHIYRLEGGAKRWIVDIETFEVEGHVWEDVRLVPCQRLRNLPDGESIPPGHGTPPQP